MVLYLVVMNGLCCSKALLHKSRFHGGRRCSPNYLFCRQRFCFECFVYRSSPNQHLLAMRSVNQPAFSKSQKREKHSDWILFALVAFMFSLFNSIKKKQMSQEHVKQVFEDGHRSRNVNTNCYNFQFVSTMVNRIRSYNNKIITIYPYSYMALKLTGFFHVDSENH